MFKSSELERLYRDVRCGGFHPANPMLTYEIVGKTALGIGLDEQPRLGLTAAGLSDAQRCSLAGPERGQKSSQSNKTAILESVPTTPIRISLPMERREFYPVPCSQFTARSPLIESRSCG